MNAGKKQAAVVPVGGAANEESKRLKWEMELRQKLNNIMIVL